MSAKLEIVDDPAGACAERLVSAASAGGNIVLTGGGTPGAAYEQAARTADAWREATLWFGDERCVSPEDERSNYRLVRDSLLSPLGEPSPVVHRMQGELGPEAGAEAYQRELEQAGPPRFDLLLLGLGPDGHLASLFPDQQSLAERSRWVVGVQRAGLEPFVPRISMTFRALAWARTVVFLVSGESKADAVAAAFGPDARPDPHVPSSVLPSMVDDLTVLLDPAAAERLAPRSAR